MLKILLLLLILCPNLSSAQYYYSPYPPTYPAPNYLSELNNYIQQQYVNDQQVKWEDDYSKKRAWEKSEEYKDPWGYKKKHQPFDDD
jgi:hypothetical protein